jgi:solute carrier family 35 (UDP-sugar transporter), member A1/2/3
MGIVIQSAASVLVGRYTRRPEIRPSDLYDVNHMILVTELGKLFLSCIVEQITTNGKLMQSIQKHIIKQPCDTLKILVPASLYLLQNSLFYVALSNLTVPMLQVTYQAKLVTTAIVSVVMLNRKYSIHQWICLVSLSLGVAIVIFEESDTTRNSPNDGTQSLAKGLCAVMISCISSAFAGVYFESLVKNFVSQSAAAHVGSQSAAESEPVSVWMRNMQLAFFTVVILFVQSWCSAKPDTDVASIPFLHGFTTLTWILVGLQAGGGLLVAAVIKYADNVLKGLATAVSVCLVTAVSAILFHTPVGAQFSAGVFIILISVFFFLNPVKKKKPAPISPWGGENDLEETKHILPK